MGVVDELQSVLELDDVAGDTPEAFAKFLIYTLDELPDTTWDSLSPSVVGWFNEAAEAVANKKAPVLPSGIELLFPPSTLPLKKPEGPRPKPTRRDDFKPNWIITLISTKNPYRAKSMSRVWFGKYEDGMTVQAAMDEGAPPAQIRQDSRYGYINVDPAK